MRVLALLAPGVLLLSCGEEESQRKAKEPPKVIERNIVARLGSVSITSEDLKYHLEDRFDGRQDPEAKKVALDELIGRARAVQRALDQRLDENVAVKAEYARLLESQLRQVELGPKLREALDEPVSEADLKEAYERQIKRFRSNAKRQIAVLWLNPGNDPDRLKRFQAKLEEARDWLFSNAELQDDPAKGFGTLSIDHSEHAGSRYKGGVFGWVEENQGIDDWTKVVADIAFGIGQEGGVSEVVTRKEGVFLVRLMKSKEAFVRPLSEVRSILSDEIRSQRRRTVEEAFEKSLESSYPVEIR